MANLQVNQIRKHLTDNYIRFVDASDIKATDEDKDIHITVRPAPLQIIICILTVHNKAEETDFALLQKLHKLLMILFS